MEPRTRSWRGSKLTARSPSSKWTWKVQLKSTGRPSKATSCSSIHPPSKNCVKELETESKQRQTSKSAFRKQSVKSSLLTTLFYSQTGWSTTSLKTPWRSSTLLSRPSTSRRSRSSEAKRLTARDKTRLNKKRNDQRFVNRSYQVSL